MKKFANIKSILFVALAVSLVFTACSNGLSLEEKKAGTDEAYIKVGKAEVRDALPVVNSYTEFTSFTLTGTPDDEGLSVNESFTADAESTAAEKLIAKNIAVTPGRTYVFTLTAQKGGATWSGSITKLISNGVNELDFSLILTDLGNGGNGSFSVEFTLPDIEGLEAESALYRKNGTQVTGLTEELQDNTLTLSRSTIAPGTYYVSVTLSKDGVPLQKPFIEYIGIAGGFESTSSVTITEEDLYSMHTLAIELNGGELSETLPAWYTRKTAEITLPEPVRSHYRFLGWFNNAEFEGDAVTKVAGGRTGSLTLYAKWSTKYYTVTFDAANGSSSVSVEVDENTTVTEPAEPEKRGYTFAGWFEDDEQFSFETGVQKDYALTAHWTLVNYTISYEGLEEGEENPNPATYTIEDTVVLQDAVREHYSFNGWKRGNADISVISEGTTGDITLTSGGFTEILYSLNLVRTGGSSYGLLTANVTQNIHAGTDITITFSVTDPNADTDDYYFNNSSLYFDVYDVTNYYMAYNHDYGSTPEKSWTFKMPYRDVTIEYAPVWRWKGTKKPTAPKAIGDIVFGDDSATPYDQIPAGETVSGAKSIIYYEGKDLSASDKYRVLGVAVTNAATGVKMYKQGDNVNITETYLCARFTGLDTEKPECTDSYDDSFDTSYDCDGYDNDLYFRNKFSWWQSEHFPPFEPLSISYSDWNTSKYGWYLPSAPELYKLGKVMNTVNAALAKCSGASSLGEYIYWSSSSAYVDKGKNFVWGSLDNRMRPLGRTETNFGVESYNRPTAVRYIKDYTR